MANRAHKFAPILFAVIITMLFSHVFTARAGNNNMYPVAAEVGRIAVYLDENAVQPGQDAILVTKNSNGSFTNQGSACPIAADEAARWLGVEANEMTLVDTGYEKYWAFKSNTGKLKRIRVPFGTFQDYRGTYSAWSNINADSGTWRCGKPSQTNVVNDAPMAPTLTSCPNFGGKPTTLDGGNCLFSSKDPVRGLVPAGFTADYWDSAGAKAAHADEGTEIFTTTATFKPKPR